MLMSAGPNFFIIGAPQCGTTSLADLLAQHPEVYFCPEKEPRFSVRTMIVVLSITKIFSLAQEIRRESARGAPPTVMRG
ncbi:sulfotransferase [Salinibacter ruber]|uniref:sulfotransferase n=1 Tax=Salinibacter ruber TaxID=146919 RepID=UPI003C6E6CA3